MGHLSHRDAKTNALELQLTQIRFMTYGMEIARDARVKSLQLEIEEMKLSLLLSSSSSQSQQPSRYYDFLPNPLQGATSEIDADVYFPVKLQVPSSPLVPTPSALEEDYQDFAPTQISHQEQTKPLTEKTKTRTYKVPMQDFFIVQSMMD